MAGFLTSASASLTTGTKLITISGNVDCSFVVSGTAVYLNNILMEGVSGTSPDPSGNSSITLRNIYNGSSIVGGTLVAFNTIEGLRDAIQRARELAATQLTNNSQLDIFLTNATTSVDLELPSGTATVSPYQYISGLVLSNDVKQYAMSQAQFEAIRAQNNEQFAASGFVHFGKHYSSVGVSNINQGLWVYPNVGAENALFMGYEAGIEGKSKTNRPVLNIAGIAYELFTGSSLQFNESFRVKLPQAPDGKTTYNKSTGVNTVHASAADAFAAQAADTTNIEVVINRVDMWGFEAWLEEVNTTNPYVYPNGLIQSQAETMEDIATSASARQVTYYAAYEGDTGSKGKGLNYFALSDANKKKVLANSKNNLYYLDDGRLVQWRLRQRTIAGAGNGDWSSVSPVVDSYSVRFSAINDLIPQGILNTTSNRQPNQYFYSSMNPPLNINTEGFYNEFGVYQIRPVSADLCGINNECYFLVCGTVNRLNQGAYHPSFNPSGAGSFILGNGAIQTVWSGDLLNVPTSTLHCFTKPTSPYPYTDGYQYPAVGNGANVGSVSSEGSGRPDGRFYDAFYADGDGGVCRDMRYSAYGIDSVDYAEADHRVKNGTYRGFEEVRYTYPYAARSVYLNLAATQIDLGEVIVASINLAIGDTLFLVSSSAVLVCKNIEDTRYPACKVVSGTPNRNTSDVYYLLVCKDIGISWGGVFLQTDVIGSPANILVTPALANGWQGSWIPVIPTGSALTFPMTRKALTSISGVYTNNNGGTWIAHTGFSFDSTINSYKQVALGAGLVFINNYQAFSKQTENAANAEVYGGAVGVGNVATVRVNEVQGGSLLQESLIGKVNTDTTAWLTSVNLISIGLSSKNTFISYTGYYSRHPVSMFDYLAPPNDSPAVKALNYNVNINQQAFIQYAYTELKHNGTNWGDDGKVTIVDNQSTKTDLNGNTVLVGTAKLKEPLGWIKNEV